MSRFYKTIETRKQVLSPIMKMRYRHFYIHQVISPYSNYLMLAVLVYLAFSVVDAVHLGEYTTEAILIRFTVSLISLVMLFIVKKKSAKYLEQCELILLQLVNISIVWFGVLAINNGDYNYQSGVIIVMVYIAAFSRMSFPFSLFTLFACLAGYLIWIYPPLLEFDRMRELDRVSIIGGVFLMSLFACVRRERECLSNFVHFEKARNRQLRLRANSINLRNQSQTDALTGLKNRYFLSESAIGFNQELNKNRHPHGFLMIDIDDFKAINDTFGHRMGDQVIIDVATVLSTYTTHKADVAIRYGGEEYLVLINKSDQCDLAKIAEEIRSEVSGLSYPGYKLSVTVSIGCYLSTDRDRDIEVCIDNADEALYQAKASGKNCSMHWKEKQHH
ncbi:GGDEF domain-containing protein [Aliivibrio kagoshimensis]|uniref:GGDEF domain-containing protein n=1 Tax=Aliivibrio kagoshimensis TaxID=2910230 RepID=UPI003D0EB7AF